MEISPLIEEDFERATKYVKAAPSGSFSPSEEQLLNLYSYFKQATIGPSKPEEKPAFYDMVGNAKHSAWSKLGEMSKNEAMSEYVRLVTEINEDWQHQEDLGGKKKENWICNSTLGQDNDQTPQDKKSICYLVAENDESNVMALLESDPSLVNFKDEEGRTPLHFATDRANVNLMSTFLKMNADVNAKDNEGQTALHYACTCDHLNAIELLISHGADLTICDNDGQLAKDYSNESLNSWWAKLSKKHPSKFNISVDDLENDQRGNDVINMVASEGSILIQSSGRKISYKLWGTLGNGEAWVMVHGWLDNAASFDLLVPFLISKSNHPQFFVCIDLAGHGQSSNRKEGAYHLVDYVADIHLVTQSLNIQNFTLVGHSLGAGISSIYSGTFGTSLTRLILLEGLTPSNTNPGECASMLHKSLTSPLQPIGEYDSEQIAAKRRADKNIVGTLPLESALILASRGLTKNGNDNGKVSWRYDVNLKQISRYKMSFESIREFVRQIKCPVLFIVTPDGLYGKASIGGIHFHSLLGYFIYNTIYYLCFILSKLPFLGAFIKKYYILLFTPACLASYFQAYSRITVSRLNGGGHHPHLIPHYADLIANQIIQWKNSL